MIINNPNLMMNDNNNMMNMNQIMMNINPMMNNNIQNNMMNNNNQNQMMNPMMMNNNMMNMNQMMNNNMMLNFMQNNNNVMLNQRINNDGNPMIYKTVKNKMEIIFHMMYPNFNLLNPNDVQMKQNWENQFLEIYNRLNNIKNEKNEYFDNKIIINYYDLYKKEIYFDSFLNIEHLISHILSLLGYYDMIKNIYKRFRKKQTTKYIIENPLKKIKFLIFDETFFYFEFNGDNLINSFNKKLNEIGLINGKEMNIKLINEYYKNKNEIRIYFGASSGLKVCIKCDRESIVKSAIEKFCRKLDISWEKVYKDIYFLFKGHSIVESDFNKNIEKYFGKYPKVTVIDTTSLIGAGPPVLDFVDVSSGKIKKLVFSDKAPIWRRVSKGLNIFGICNNSKCKAWKKEVVYTNELEEKLIFILNNEILNIKCPICSKIIKPKTCGFWKCEYQFVGKKIEEGEVKFFDSKTRETNGEDFEYFDAFENGETQWAELTIYVLPKQEMKYQ